jgi:hypothetical protein
VKRVSLVAGLVLAFALAPSANATNTAGRLVLTFGPTNPRPGRQVVVRTVSTSSGAKIVTKGVAKLAPFRGSGSMPVFDRPVHVYLVPNRYASSVTSRNDSRLVSIGVLSPGGELRFAATHLRNVAYAAVVWCPSCARSQGRSLFVLGVGNDYTGLTPLMLLRPHGFAGPTRVVWPFYLLAGIALAALVSLLTWARYVRARKRSNSQIWRASSGAARL